MNFFNDSWTVNQHYALALAQDYFVITHYLRALSENTDARLQVSRSELAVLQSRYSLPNDLFLQLLQRVKPFDIFESMQLVRSVPKPQRKLLLLLMSFHQMTPLQVNNNKVFDAKEANVLKKENPEASVLELVHLAVEKYDCEPLLAAGFELRDQFLSLMGPYLTLVNGPSPPPRPVAYTLFLGVPKYTFFDAQQAHPVIQRQFVRHATLCNAYEILFPATIPATVKLKEEIMRFPPSKTGTGTTATSWRMPCGSWPPLSSSKQAQKTIAA